MHAIGGENAIAMNVLWLTARIKCTRIAIANQMIENAHAIVANVPIIVMRIAIVTVVSQKTAGIAVIVNSIEKFGTHLWDIHF